MDDARKSLAWALEMEPAALPMDANEIEGQKQTASKLSDIFRYPRSLAVSWITNLGAQTGYYGLTLWVPTLLVQLLGVTPAKASFLLIFVNFAGLFGRLGLSYLSDAIGRRPSGAIASFGAAALTITAAIYHSAFIGTDLEEQLRDVKNETGFAALATQRDIQLQLIGSLEADLLRAKAERDAAQAEVEQRRRQLRELEPLIVTEQTLACPKLPGRPCEKSCTNWKSKSNTLLRT
jgi:hypothetical protein